MTTCSARKVERAPSAIPIVFYPAAGHSSCLTVVAPVSIHRSRARSLARSLARVDRTDSDKRRRVATASIPSCAIYPRTRVACSSSCPAGEGGGPEDQGRALSLCARERGSVPACLPACIPIKGSIVLAAREKGGGGRRRRKKQRERERERERVAREIVYVSTKLDGFNLERAPLRVLPLLFSRLLHQRQRIQACVCVRTYTHVGSPHVHIRA